LINICDLDSYTLPLAARSIQSYTDIGVFLDYIKTYPSRSHKKQRLFYIPKYFELKALKAHQANPDSPLGKL